MPVRHVRFRVGARKVVGVHLNVRIELLIGVRRARIRSEEDRRVDISELGIYTDLGPPLLDQRLEILTHGVGRGLIKDLQRYAVLLADAVTVGVDHARRVQERVRASDVLRHASVIGC